jgi:hypothetical protein
MSKESSFSVLFIPCWWDGLPRESGSARIRAEWICQHWDGAQVYDGSQPLAGYDLYVFQKAYLIERTRTWIQTAARWRDRGRCRLAFDLCDPDFLNREHERRLLNVLPLFDFAVASTEPIRDWLVRWMPAYVIPDRVDVQEVQEIGRYIWRRTDKPRLIWAGYDRNAAAMDELLSTVEELGLELDVLMIDDPLPFDEFWRRLLPYDVLLNPKPDVPPFSYKSDNKTLIAWTLGMPVARTVDELRRLCEPAERWREMNVRRQHVREAWNISLSVNEWVKLSLGLGRGNE